MTAYDWLAIAVVLACILLSAFFAGSETALTASSRAAMHRLEKQGNRRAALVNRLVEARERMIGALLFGNNAVNIAASSLATGVLLSWFGDVGVIYATIVMTVLIVQSIGRATASAIRSGALKAAVFGNTSANTTIRTVITIVA